MFRILILLITFNILYADNAKMNSLNLNMAKEHYNNKNFIKAYDVLSKLVLNDYDNTLINYYLAKSAVKLEKFGIASAAYERILIKEPNLLEVMFEQSKLLYLTGNLDASIISLNKLLSKKISKNTRKEIENYLNFVKKKDTFLINTTLLFSLDYADNVNNAPNKEYTLSDFSYLGKQGDKKLSDTSHLEYINIEFINKFKDSKDISLKNNFAYLKKTFLNEKSENFESYLYQPGIFLNENMKKYYLGIILQRYQMGIKPSKNYLDSVGLETKFYDKNHVLELKAQRFFHRNENESDKNYSSYEISYNTFYETGFNIFSRFQKNISFKSNRTDLDKILFDNSLSYLLKLKKNMTIEPFFKYEMTNYEDESFAFNSKRKDRLSVLGIEFRKYIDDSSFISLKSSYLNNKSNQEEYDYKNKNIGFMYLKRFSW